MSLMLDHTLSVHSTDHLTWQSKGGGMAQSSRPHELTCKGVEEILEEGWGVRGLSVSAERPLLPRLPYQFLLGSLIHPGN